MVNKKDTLSDIQLHLKEVERVANNPGVIRQSLKRFHQGAIENPDRYMGPTQIKSLNNFVKSYGDEVANTLGLGSLEAGENTFATLLKKTEAIHGKDALNKLLPTISALAKAEFANPLGSSKIEEIGHRHTNAARCLTEIVIH